MRTIRPETALDVQSQFYDALKTIDEKIKPKDVENYFEFIDWPDKLGARFKRYLPKGFKKLAALVQSWEGEYDRDRRQFVIPKPSAKGTPPKGPTPSEATIGYYVIKPGYYPTFPIEKILSHKFSFRLNIGESISELMGEIHAAGRIIEPLICRTTSKPGWVEAGPGERRLLAARNLGMKTVPIIVDKFTDLEFDRIRGLENFARKDFTDYETARFLKYMLKEYPDAYSTQQALAHDFGKTQAWVSFHLRMLELEKDKNITRVINPEQLTEGQARAILEAPEEKRPEVAKQIAEHIEREGVPPSMRDIKSFVHPEPNPPAKPPDQEPRQREIPKPKPEALFTGFEWECPECHQKLIINHIDFSDGKIKHKTED